MRDHFYIIMRRILLVQFCTAFLDSAHSLDDVLVACGIAHAEALWVTEGIAADCCHMTYFEQVHCKVVGVLDSALSVGLAEEALALREYIESSVRSVYLQAWDFLYKSYDEVLSALESLAHLLYACL